MRFAAPFLLAAAVSATSVVFNNLKLTSNNESACTLCTDVNGGDTMALQICLNLVPAECTYTVEATLSGDATACASGYGFDLGDITGSIPGVEVTEMKGTMKLTAFGAPTGTCKLEGSASDDSKEQCSENPTGTDITAELKDGEGQLTLDNVKGRYVSLKATPTEADACGTNLGFATFETATATVTAKGLGGASGGGSSGGGSSGDGSSSEGVAPVFGASLLITLLGALHIA